MAQVELTYQEMVLGCTVGLTRHTESVAKRRTPHFPEKFPDQMLLSHQLGACAELAFCKLVDRFYSPTVNTFKAPDIGDDIEVRWSNNGRLKVRPDDVNVYCVAMSGNLPRFVYHGWMWSEDAKRDEWKADPNGWGKPAYFVPNDQLRRGKIKREGKQVASVKG